MRLSLLLLPWALNAVVAKAGQETPHRDSYNFERKIQRVAVIGAGATGLLQASTLLQHGFDVRLFERAAQPGGTWLYNKKPPVAASFPNRPIEVSGYIPDIPSSLPQTRLYHDGDEGITNEWRLREHWAPSSAWKNLVSTYPPTLLTLPGVRYPEDVPWQIPRNLIQRHVHQFASSVGLNSNDDEYANVTSYSTRVERIHKPRGAAQWTLTLRRMEELPFSNGTLRVNWWTETFDGVVVATFPGEMDAAWVPPIPGLDEWANAYPEQIFHGRQYRTSAGFEEKDVLIIGASQTASGIATDLMNHARSVTVSMRTPAENRTFIQKALRRGFPANITEIPEIVRISHLQPSVLGVRDATMILSNGSAISGFDKVILATGYRRSYPFLVDYHNSSIVGYEEPETKVAPIITDGTHVRSLYWTGHYILDPTLAIATVQPWQLGPYQALGFARVWKGTAKLPSPSTMWQNYEGPGRLGACVLGPEELCSRRFIAWLNSASLEFGGRFVGPLPSTNKWQEANYFFSKVYDAPNVYSLEQKAHLEGLPCKKWRDTYGLVCDLEHARDL